MYKRNDSPTVVVISSCAGNFAIFPEKLAPITG